MPGNNRKLFVLIIIAAFFIAGVAKLFVLRFEAGDFYPAYSSLRSDPVGTKALYESLNNLDNISATRNFLPLKRVRSVSDATFLYLGVSVYDIMYLSEDSLRMIEQSVTAGTRMVFSFLPVRLNKKKFSDKYEYKNKKTDQEKNRECPEKTNSKQKDEDKDKHKDGD
ncbi:MAG: hypothetical protein GY749_40145 [Desulfobacteraceae bacterium]|nr:hypothetical protein [Desulfobacteraceae bacterium]